MSASFNSINVTEHDDYIILSVNGVDFNLEVESTPTPPSTEVKVGDVLTALYFDTSITPDVSWPDYYWNDNQGYGGIFYTQEFIGSLASEGWRPIIGALKIPNPSQAGEWIYGIGLYPNASGQLQDLVPLWASDDMPLDIFGLSVTLPAGWQPTIQANPTQTIDNVTVRLIASQSVNGYSGTPFNGVWVKNASALPSV